MTAGLSAWTWPVDGWIVAIGALAAIACALPGAWLVARRESMIADAIAHAVLPGIALAFLVSGSRAPGWMLAGAMLAAAALAGITQFLRTAGRIERGAALGVAYTTLFAVGVLMVSGASRRVDLDPSCVLFGSIETAPLDVVEIGPLQVPRAALLLAAVALANLAVMVPCWRRLLAASFDRAHAATAGMRPGLADALVSASAAATCVACFESVGSILVIALMVVPAAAARMASVSLSSMAGRAAAIGVAGALLGHIIATGMPAALGLERVGIRDASSAGSMALAMGILLAGIAAGRRILARPAAARGAGQ